MYMSYFWSLILAQKKLFTFVHWFAIGGFLEGAVLHLPIQRFAQL